MSLIHTSLDAPSLTASADSRTIEGIAVVYDGPGSPSGMFGGRTVSFAPGSLDRSLKARASKVRLLVQHDMAHPIGRLTSWVNKPDGLFTTWRIASTPAGDSALVEASEGIRDGLSVGVEVLRYDQTRGTIRVTEGRLLEVSLVSIPAFDDARVSRVAASHHLPGRDPRSLRLSLLLKGI